MAFRACAANHLNTGDGCYYQKILSSQQTCVRAIAYGGSSLRTGRLLGIFASTIIIIGRVRQRRELLPRCLSIPKHGFRPFPDKYSTNARQTTCAEASSAPHRHGQDRP